jgi:prepilin-type N-terminal cleavage/methylation domain-containing protein/prepilin-type processing-associated H-X9-DG protein
MRPAHRTRRPHHRRGFTLIEILMVIGIIAVLAGLLLTVRSRATTKATQAMCLSNLRQLGMAFTQYAQSNEQAFPFGAPADALGGDRKEDWIHFRATIENLPKKIGGSAIAPYVGAKGDGFIKIMQCPSDEMETHQSDPRAGFPYRYSYTMNYAMTSELVWGKRANRGATPRVTSIQRASEKILLAEENERTINDGLWVAGTYSDPNDRKGQWNVNYDYLSIRHDGQKQEFINPQDFQGRLLSQLKRGNVLFVDGHADFITRRDAHSAQHILVSDEGNGTAPIENN